MSTPTDSGEDLAEKLSALVTSHRRFVQEFEHSLDQSAHFLELADRSMEHEPEDTASMLSQILEIDLLGHLQKLAEEFGGVRDYVETSPLAGEAQPYRTELNRLTERYEALEQQAAEQVTRIETLLRVLDA